MPIRSTCRVLPLLLAASGCNSAPDLDVPAAVPIDVPAAPGSALPHAAAAGSRAILSWVEPSGSGHALRFAEWDGTSWTEPLTVAHGEHWFVNWADFPSVIAPDEATRAAHWLQRSGPGTYAYDVRISRSVDRGVTWSESVRPHSDGTETEHGFVSLFPLDDGSLGVVWLDGRKYASVDGAPATNEMTVRFTSLAAPSAAAARRDEVGTAASPVETLLDGRVCDCCQTDVAQSARGPVLVYRDRSEREVRDIAVIRRVNGSWTAPQRVHADDWVIDACPVNGPQADAHGDTVVVAWFTAARDTPRVNVAFSTDAGASFTAPVRVDGGNPVGRVDVLMLDAERALVVWLERTGAGAEVTGRVVHVDGSTGDRAPVAETLAQRPSGFPRMARYDGGVLLAWTQPGDSSRVRAAVLELSAR